MKKAMRFIIPGILALAVAITALICVERVPAGYVGVVYSAIGLEDQTLSQGWHFLSPMKQVKRFPISQQQIVFSDDPADYNKKEHPDWHIDAPANGGMVSINLTVNYNFVPDRVVDLYKRFNGMDGESIVESRVQNSIIAYVKEVTPRFSVMDIYSDKKQKSTRPLRNISTKSCWRNMASTFPVRLSLTWSWILPCKRRSGSRSRQSRTLKSRN